MVSTAVLPDRWEQILRIIQQQGSATVQEIVQAVGVSEATVRRDLARIARRGLITRTWGGATLLQNVPYGPSPAESRNINPQGKQAVGREAARLVKDGDTIILDGGVTTCQVARYLEARNISVVTNSLEVVQVLFGRNDVRIVMIGGEISRLSGTAVGPQTDLQLQQLQAAKAFLGADALSQEVGLCSPDPQTAHTKRAMIHCARELVVVADHTKLGKYATYKVTPLESITTLVTDSEADPAMLESFRMAGINVICAQLA
jgi:DeoR/GlpR family transcriptional regulator of sugar metabolism